jgi:hypothetical protein
MEVESQIRSLRDFQFQRDDVLAQEEWKREMVIRDLAKERENFYKMEVFHESREMALKAEIAELKGKVMEQELRNDYLSSQLLAYEDRIERQKRVLQELQEKEKKRAFTRCGLQDHCNALEDEAERVAIDSTYNAHHLTHYIKCTEFLQDKMNRLRQAWVDADAKRVQEIEMELDTLPPEMRRKPHRQTFHVEPTKLNLAACSSVDYPQVPRTEMLERALARVARIHRTDDELRAMDATSEASTSTAGPSTPPITPGQE